MKTLHTYIQRQWDFHNLIILFFEKYRLVKEQPAESSKTGQNDELDIQSIILSIDKINEQIEALWVEIDALKDSSAKEKTTTRNGNGKRDKNGDD